MIKIQGVEQAVAEARKSMRENGLSSIRYTNPQAVAARALGRDGGMARAMELDAERRQQLQRIADDPTEKARIWLQRWGTHSEMLRQLGRLLALAETALDHDDAPENLPG